MLLRGLMTIGVPVASPETPVGAKQSDGKTMSITQRYEAFQESVVHDVWLTAWKAHSEKQRYFVWIKPRGLSAVTATNSPGEGWEILTPEPIPTDKTREQLASWLIPMLRRAPVLPVGDV